jgi:chromosomal replication initiation ATPase DnaA
MSASITPLAKQIPLDLGVRPAQGREDFLVSPCNQNAVGWIDKWPDWPAPFLVLQGAPACGKSHLAAVWRERVNAATIKPETLTTHSAEELSQQAKHLVIDGIDLWLGDRDAETTLFHIYNIFKEQNRTALLTIRMSPTHSDFIIPDLASRVRAAPVATIDTPDDDVLAAVLVKLFSDRQISISSDVLRYTLPRIERSFAALRDIVEAADHMALSEKRAISVPLMRSVLSKMS